MVLPYDRNVSTHQISTYKNMNTARNYGIKNSENNLLTRRERKIKTRLI